MLVSSHTPKHTPSYLQMIRNNMPVLAPRTLYQYRTAVIRLFRHRVRAARLAGAAGEG